MKNVLFIVLSLLISGNILAQTQEISIDSKLLKSNQSISIRLPEHYNEDHTTRYPVILVLNGDYLLKPAVGQVDYQTYFGEIPESILVGVNQENILSYDDSDLTSDKALLISAKYSSFISDELLPYLNKNYNTNGFNVIVGNNTLSNFMLTFMSSKTPIFQAYVNLNPVYTYKSSQNFIEEISVLTHEMSYYIAASTNNSELTNATLLSTINQLKDVENKRFKFNFDDFDNASQHTVVMRGIARALEKVFDKSQVIAKPSAQHKVYSYDNSLED